MIAALLLLWVLAEVALAVVVAHVLGVLVCVLLLLAGWPVGILVARVRGRATLAHLRGALLAGHGGPGSGAEELLGLLAAPLFLLPGFLTDGLALLLLVPMLRRRLWTLAARAIGDRLAGARGRAGAVGGRFGARRPFDVEGTAREAPRREHPAHRPSLHP